RSSLHTLSLHDSLPIYVPAYELSRPLLPGSSLSARDRSWGLTQSLVPNDHARRHKKADACVVKLCRVRGLSPARCLDRSTSIRRSEEHTSELQSPDQIL